ncbi:9800_t:CDS:2, partial [Scutellospora calospora]
NLTPIEQYPLSIPIVPNQYTMEDQIIDNTSHDTTIYEGKEDYYYDDDYDTSDASYRDFNKFISEFYQVEAQDPIPEKIGSIIESWFSEKLTYNGEIGESIPILQESPRILAEGIMIKLRKCDEIIMEPHYKNFYEQVLVTVEHATYKEENCDVPRCYGNESDNQRQNFRSFNTRMITTSSADGQMFCLLEKCGK